jgi:hypothetical protein
VINALMCYRLRTLLYSLGDRAAGAAICISFAFAFLVTEFVVYEESRSRIFSFWNLAAISFRIVSTARTH